ncbi:DUF4817 domain-containing protein [Trichonephila clavipes]|nr:DUF4817 domain-containing protein [Trichonephila clavipes]
MSLPFHPYPLTLTENSLNEDTECSAIHVRKSRAGRPLCLNNSLGCIRQYFVGYRLVSTTTFKRLGRAAVAQWLRPIGTKIVELSAIPINLLSIKNFLKLNSENLVGSIKHGGRSVLAWGCKSDTELDNRVALHFKYDQARRRFVEWAQNEIAVVPDFHKRILFSDEAHFWLNGYVNKQNCRIWSEANPQVYVETPLHPEKLTVWCALWTGGILLQKR